MRSLFLLGIVVHLILLYSIFDIYYSSPIIFGLPHHEITHGDAPAKRIIFFSADGLRYDSFVNNPERSPFLHDIIGNKKGVWALSLSHMPTESRPGHVSLFAGFTEDVSAVAAGWKKNPVPFDSIFNRSTNSWLIGSPDIVELFPVPRAMVESYSSEEEDFSSNEAYKLDEWVFKKFETLISRAKSDSQLKQRLESLRNIFFLHLLGLDTNGHGHKPSSQEYSHNIEFVDMGIKNTVKLSKEFFGDENTAFIFTSDHGMTDWGSHGAGSDSEVMTPFVAWGAGIKRSGVKFSISQVDVAPLLAALTGVPIPTNSIGILPIEMLDATDEYIYKSTLANFLQFREQLVYLRNQKAKRFWFKEFDTFGENALNSLHQQLNGLGKSRRFSAAVTMWSKHSEIIRDAIYYYHRYDRTFLGFCVSASFLLWVGVVTFSISRTNPIDLFSREILIPNIWFSFALMLGLFYGLYCGFSISCLIYLLLPVFLASLNWNLTTFDQSPFKKQHLSKEFAGLSKYLIFIFFGVISILPLVWVFLDRRALVFVFIMLNFIPYTYGSIRRYNWKIMWHVICLILCVFPFLSTVGKNQHPILCVIASLMASFIYKVLGNSHFLTSRRKILVFISKINLLATIIICSTEFLFDKTPSVLRFFCWSSLPAAFTLPIFMTKCKVTDRLIAFFGALFIPYSLLSIAYESVFLLLFIALLVILIRFEFSNFSDPVLLQLDAVIRKDRGIMEPINKRDAIRAWLIMALIIGALFGTGNFASLNSFNPSALHRFISVFSPFIMATLLIFKMVIPLIMLAMTFATLLFFDTDAITRFTYITLAISDFIAMCLFHQLQDTGSWLDIGLSISAYVVSMCLSLAILALLFVSTFILTFSSPFMEECLLNFRLCFLRFFRPNNRSFQNERP